VIINDYHCDYDGIINNCIINHYLESITIVCTYGPIVVILSVDNYGSSTIIYIDNINSKKIQAGKIWFSNHDKSQLFGIFFGEYIIYRYIWYV